MWFPFPPNEQGRRAGRLYKEALHLHGKGPRDNTSYNKLTLVPYHQPSAIHQTSRSRVLHRKVA